MRLDFGKPANSETTHTNIQQALSSSGVQNVLMYANQPKITRKRQFDNIDLTPVLKRRKFQCFTSTPKSETTSLSPISSIIQAIDKLSTESDLVADGSRANILPTIPGKHSDLSAISPETMSDVLDGVYDKCVDKVTIIDCRYPYEFEGGHIKVNIKII